jgi:hypothetical protein
MAGWRASRAPSNGPRSASGSSRRGCARWAGDPARRGATGTSSFASASALPAKWRRRRPPPATSPFPPFWTGSTWTAAPPCCSRRSRDDRQASWPSTTRSPAPRPAEPAARCTTHWRKSRPRPLHLDLHPLNVLVDDDGEPTGVIDWANAAAGDPELDRARTWSLLTLDPAARALDEHPGWAALTEHWLGAGRLHALSTSARLWACRFMLRDLAGRHTRAELAHIHDAVRLSGGSPPGMR